MPGNRATNLINLNVIFFHSPLTMSMIFRFDVGITKTLLTNQLLNCEFLAYNPLRHVDIYVDLQYILSSKIY